MLRLVCFLSLSLWLCWQHVVAQQPLLVPVKTGLSEEHRLSIIYPADDGYIYLGSGAEVFRFNGLSSEVVGRLNTPNQVFTSFFSYRNELWLGASDGKIYLLRAGKFMLFAPQEGLPSAAISDFASDAAGQLWIATRGEGVYCWTGKRLYHFGLEDGLPDAIINQLHLWNNSMWAATDGGLLRLSLHAGKKKLSVFTTEHGLPDNIITQLSDDKQRLILGFESTGPGFYDTKSYQPISSNDTNGDGVGVSALQLNGDELWWVNAQQNVHVYDLISRKSRLISTSLQSKKARIHQLKSDNNGNMWWLSSQGLFRQTLAIQTLPIAEKAVQAVWVDKQNRLWYSADQALFVKYLPDGPTKKLLTKPLLNIISLYEDSKGYIWAGSFGMGLWQFHPDSWRATHYDASNGLENGNVFSITEQHDSLLLGTLGGIYCADLKQPKINFVRNLQPGGPASAYIFQLTTDSKGNRWIATDGEGIYRSSASGFRQYLARNPAARTFTAVAEDRRGQLWFSSPQHGLFVYQGDSLQFVLKPTNEIAALASLGDFLYIVHAQGIDRMHLITRRYFSWTAAQGLQLQEPYTNALFKDSRDIWIGGQQEIFRIRNSQTAVKGPKMLLKTVSIAGQAHDTSQHQLAANDNQISFAFDGLWFEDAEALHYRFKMEGYGTAWVNTRNREITFPRLTPGDYNFILEAALNDNFEGATAISWSFRIAQPIYLRWWFVLIALLSVLSLTMAYIRSRDKRLKKQAQILQEKIEAQFETLKSQVSPHFLFNSFNTLLALIETNPKKAAEYVEQLSDLFRNILKYREKDLITVAEELELIAAYAYLQEQRFGADFKLEIVLDDANRKSLIPPLTLQLLVENAIKHNVISHTQPLVVRIYSHHNQLIVSNVLQPKTNPESSTGFGLRSIRDRYKLLTDQPVEISEVDNHFQISLPLLQTL